MLVAGVGLIYPGYSSAFEGNAEKITVSKDIDPNFASIKMEELGTMTASWYGPRFHGRLTANGETYNQMSFTAAHKSMSFGTFLKVTNIKNGKSVVVRINDRGPYVEGRDLDLSKGTAIALGMVKRGVIKVKVEEIKSSTEIPPVDILE